MNKGYIAAIQATAKKVSDLDKELLRNFDFEKATERVDEFCNLVSLIELSGASAKKREAVKEIIAEEYGIMFA